MNFSGKKYLNSNVLIILLSFIKMKVRKIFTGPSCFANILSKKIKHFLVLSGKFCLKGNVSRDFRPSFFHDSIPSRPLINRIKYFRIHIRQDIRRKKNPQYAPYCGVKLHGVHHTMESRTAVCIPLRSQALRCASHRGVK